MKDKVVVISGGTSGIGKTTAQYLTQKGAIVVILSVDNEKVMQQAIEDIGNHVECMRCDVSNEKEVQVAFEKIIEKYGRIDCAFNNAGVGPDGVRIPYQSLTEVDEKTWDLIVNVDMKGVFICMKYELKQMQKQGYGSIVNTASIGGYRMAPHFGAYGPAKAGVIALTELGAIENAKYHIRVNAICPGPTADTQLTQNTILSHPEQETLFKEQIIPMGKLATSQEVANTVYWLLSDLSSHTTGQKIFIDGGMHIA